MLVDSGSSHSFISETLASRLTGQQSRSLAAVKVRVADGGILQCTQELVQCIWWVQGISFQSDMKILPLGTYEVILGMD